MPGDSLQLPLEKQRASVTLEPDEDGAVMQYDVIVSYRHADADQVRPLVEALRALGLAVWFDESAIGDFESITGAIRQGLAGSRALLSWYSATYPASRPCQMELTANTGRCQVWLIRDVAKLNKFC